MRQGGPTNNRRPRGRHQGGGNGGNGGGGGNPHASQMSSNRPRSGAPLRHQTFDSNGPDVRVRGNAWQVYEKYQQLARDATSAGDRVSAENYQQHAEHYYRIIEVINESSTVEQRQQQSGPQFGQQPDVPANYYTADGRLDPQMQNNPNIQQQDSTQQNQQPEQAEVQKRNPPPSPFFTQEELEDTSNNSNEPLVARG